MARMELRKVSKQFVTRSGSVHALRELSLDVAEGEFLCLVGSSGCGKSTLLNVMAGLEIPDSGEVLLGGERIRGPGSDRVLLFQEPALFPWLNVIDNVAFGLRMAGVPAQERADRARALLETVNLSKFGKNWIHELSGGMKQRVALAGALALDPGVLLMDEPFAALDAQTRDQLHEELEALWERTRKTIIFVTHNVREAVRLGSRVLLMSTGTGRIAKEYPVPLPRHRHLEDVELVKIASVIRDDLRAEVVR